MPTQLYILILAIGAIQGIVMGGILLKKDVPNPRANRFLAILLFFLAYRLIVEILRTMELVGVYHWSYHILLEYNWIYGPLIYFYIASFTDPSFNLTRKDWIHFLPVGIEVLFSNWVKTQNFYWDGDPGSLPWLGAESYVLWMHTPFPYVVAGGLILYYTYRSSEWIHRLTQDQSRRLEIQTSSLTWIQRILWAYRIFAILSILAVAIDYFFFNYAFEPLYPFPIYLSMALLTYWLGLEGFARRKEIPFMKKKKTVLAMGKGDLQKIIDEIDAVMKEGFYKREDANLKTLAEAVGYKPYIISQVINEFLRLKVNDYLNLQRVEEVKRLMRHPDYQNYTLTAIGLEAGFQSKASFNRSFKKHTSYSPSEYRESLSQLSE